jgi:hypothetical protein
LLNAIEDFNDPGTLVGRKLVKGGFQLNEIGRKLRVGLRLNLGRFGHFGCGSEWWFVEGVICRGNAELGDAGC